MSNEALIAEFNAEHNLDLSGIKLTDRETQIMQNFAQNEWSCICVEGPGPWSPDVLLETETVTAWECRYLYSRSNDICEGVKNPSGVVSSLNKKGLVKSYTDEEYTEGPLDCMCLTELGTAMLVKMINDTPIADRKIFKRW